MKPELLTAKEILDKYGEFLTEKETSILNKIHMAPQIEVIDDKIYYSIPELEIEIELTQHSDGLEPGFFTDTTSEEYWEANWERIEDEVANHLAENGILTNKFKR